MIDLYCERAGPGLWGEPLNLLSNLAFLVAAWVIWRDRAGPMRVSRLMAALVAGISVGSAIFHATATPGARRLDEGPIVLFELVFLWLYARRIVKLPAGISVVSLAALVVLMGIAREETEVLNGSLAYVPPLVLAMSVGAYHYRTQTRRQGSVLSGALIFAAAIAVRSMDLAVCQAVPIGTHFVWHVLVACALVSFVRGLAAGLSE